MWKVLIADDFRNCNVVLEACSQGSFSVSFIKCSDLSALAQAEIIQPDIVLIDLFAPMLRGEEYLQALRARSPNMLVIVLTARKEMEYVQRALERQIFDYIVMPAEPRRIAESLRRAAAELEQRSRQQKLLLWCMQYNRPVLAGKLVDSFLNGAFSAKETAQHLACLGMHLSSCNALLLASSLPNTPARRVSAQSLAEQFELVERQLQSCLRCVPRHLTFRCLGRHVVSFFCADPVQLAMIRQKSATGLDNLFGAGMTVRSAHLACAGSDILHCLKTAVEDAEHQKNCSPIVALIRSYIENNYSHCNIGLQEAADRFNISVSYINRLMRRELHSSFGEYLTRVRMQRALELLQDPSVRIQTIAAAVGYGDQHYFSNAFKKLMGTSPAAYRLHAASKEAEKGGENLSLSC